MKGEDTKKELLYLIKKLVSFKTVSGNTEEKKNIINFVSNYFKENDIDHGIFEHEESPAILAEIDNQAEKTILLVAHLDVVPASDELFDLKIDGDKLYGRGVLDDKGPVVGTMIFLKNIKNKNINVNVKVLFTSDEEVGGFEGAGRLVGEGVFDDIQAVFVFDGGNEKEIVCKEKGVIHLDLEVKGKSAHNARPWLGENAIEKVLQIYEDLKNIFEDEMKEHPDNWYSTVSIGKIEGGEAINKVPDLARVGIDIRFTEKYNLKYLENKITEILKDRAEVKKMITGDLLDSDPNHEIIKNYKLNFENIIKCKVKNVCEHGSGDARFFNKLNIPVWLHYPEGGKQHTEEEWLSLNSLHNMINSLESFISGLR